ncbi:MAG TPA: carboxypeptidase regulatory-like domain-containing protein [Pyrinomonadaceae bacterium]|nr:carboxypeptidase regulatory-like domain-containing protein [Pyrinomonadaceae bacterium]
MKTTATAAACLLFVFLLSATTGAQQPATSTLSGTVTDQNGAVVPDTQITVTQKATGIVREVKTNEEGFFALTNLPAGDYEVRAGAAGFKTALYTSLALQVAQSVTLDIKLEVGEISDRIDDLYSLEPLVNINSAVVDQVVDKREIENLPLNGRNFLELALLAPGNAPAPNFDPTKTNVVTISSAGQLGRGGNVMIDGMDNNDDVVGGPLQNISQEAVQEFQIATNRFSAELGRSGSSVINIVTKSGTNVFHGSASAFFRDRRFQGLPATFDRSTFEKPPFDRQQYAFAAGGPIKKDRAWFFGALEYRNQDGAILVGTRDVAQRTITRAFAPAPLNDLLLNLRGDLRASSQNSDMLNFRYSLQREDDVAASTLIRSIGSATQRQSGRNNYHSFLTNWVRVFSPIVVNSFTFSVSNFLNRTEPVAPGPQLTFPSLQDGASFRVPQQTKQNRLQFSDALSTVSSSHTWRFGGEFQKVDADFNLGVFQQGRIELVEDFASADRNGDGRVDDNDLLFAVTLRSAVPERPLLIPDADSNYFAFFAQDDWRVTTKLALNLGVRYELDTDVKNVSRADQLNPLAQPFLRGERSRDTNNFGPRFGFNYSPDRGRTSIHGGYGIYYDRVTLEIQSLERGLDGRALPIAVRAGNALSDPSTGLPIFFDPATGRFFPFAPTLNNPFTGFVLPGAGAGGINIIDNDLQNPLVQQFNLGVQREFLSDFVLRVDYLHNLGTHFIIGRTIGTVFNPVVGGPDRIVNLESSVNTKYDGLLVSFEKRYSRRYQFRAAYTLSKAFNYANDDQIPFSNGPVNPANLRLEYGPTPNDQRHRFVFAGVFDLPKGFHLSPIWTVASGVPMDILLPDGSSRIPSLQRNAGGRLFKTGAELNDFIRQLNAAGGVGGQPLPLVRDDARFNDPFNSVDLRVSRKFSFTENVTLEPIVEVFNLFNVTNVLGVSNVNYSGFSNVLIRDSNNPADPGFLRSSGFGRAVTTAGGVFGSGGPRAFQFAARFTF